MLLPLRNRYIIDSFHYAEKRFEPLAMASMMPACWVRDAGAVASVAPNAMLGLSSMS